MQAYIVNYTYHNAFDDITKSNSVLENLLIDIKEGNGSIDNWSAPRWASIGDIAFFMEAKTTPQLLSKHQKHLYDMGVTNLTYKEFIRIMPRLCLNKFSENGWIMNSWMTYSETDENNIFAKNSGFSETLIIEEPCELPLSEKTITFYSFDNNPEIAVVGFDSLKQYVFDHQDEIGYFWTDYDLAIPTIKELVLNRELCDRYGGKIFAVGTVSSIPEIEPGAFIEGRKRNPIFANYENVTLLEHPIDIKEFREYITISRQGAITPVFADAFDKLKEEIMKENKLPSNIENAIACPVSLSKVNNKNWLEVSATFRRKFTLESQFRAYYVDRLLKSLSSNHQIYRECTCYHSKSKRNSRPRVDNVIKISDKYLPIEVKLNIRIETDIKRQCASYCEIDKCELNSTLAVPGSKMLQQVLVIDTSFIYLYTHSNHSLEILVALDDIKTQEDVKNFRFILEERLLV